MKLYSTGEAARLLGVHRQTILYRYLKAGTLVPSYQVTERGVEPFKRERVGEGHVRPLFTREDLGLGEGEDEGGDGKQRVQDRASA